jgi:dTMP kinase
MHARGRLVVFEGGEGVGKSTQLRRLVERLRSTAIPHSTYREPGGTPVGDRIRDLLLHVDAPLAPTTEAALFIASRAELVATAVRPALDRGEHVLLDRFLLSTYAYQVHGRGLPEVDVQAANRLATAGTVPDLTVLLQLPPTVGLERARARGNSDRMERADRAFHERVAEAFASFATVSWQAAHPECGRIVGVSAEGDEDDVAERVAQVIERECPEIVALPGVRA